MRHESPLRRGGATALLSNGPTGPTPRLSDADLGGGTAIVAVVWGGLVVLLLGAAVLGSRSLLRA
jgi:hypothetical protein